MAGKCKEMSKIKQVLRLHKDGMSNRRIGRELGLYKNFIELCRTCSNSEKFRRTGASRNLSGKRLRIDVKHKEDRESTRLFFCPLVRKKTPVCIDARARR